ncbi:MAG: ComEC/Rec2 family competence protein [Patescibacteria group bacterium]|jgi:competence protein ComEC
MLHPSLLLRWLAIGYFLGVGAWSYWRPPALICLAVAVMSIVIAYSTHKLAWSGIVMVTLACIIGAVHITGTLSQRTAGRVAGCCDKPLQIYGTVDAEPIIGIDHQTLTIAPKSIGNVSRSARMLVRLPLGQAIKYGDIVTLKCSPSLPKPTDDFAYDKYLMLSNIRATCQTAYVEVEGSQRSHVVMRLLFQAKHWTTERLQLALPEPQASLMAGLLIGSRSGLPESVSNDFRASGVSHIIAISGYNITIIASMIFTVTCRYLGRNRSFWLVVAVLFVFTIMTGAQASVVRAAIMGIMALLAKKIGRVGAITNIWLVAGLLMIAANPMVLVYDAGFQLSFLATAGLIWISPVIEKYLKWVPQLVGIRESLASTLSATALTLPIMIGNFRQVSLISPVVNMLILPVIPAIMAVGAIIIVTAAVSATLSQIIGWFGWLGLSYILSITHWFGNLPHAAIKIEQDTTLKLLGGYSVAILIVLLRKLSAYRKKNAT